MAAYASYLRLARVGGTSSGVNLSTFRSITCPNPTKFDRSLFDHPHDIRSSYRQPHARLISQLVKTANGKRLHLVDTLALVSTKEPSFLLCPFLLVAESLKMIDYYCFLCLVALTCLCMIHHNLS